MEQSGDGRPCLAALEQTRALWEQVLCGENALLAGKTRVVVMNSHYHFLQSPGVDMVVYVEDGGITCYDVAADAGASSSESWQPEPQEKSASTQS